MSRVFAFSAVAATAVLGYALYFDYNRRTSPEFRRKLRKSEKEYKNRSKVSEEHDKKAKLETIKAKLAAALEQEPIPTDLAAKESFFMMQVTQGEQLAAAPGQEIDSAIAFYKALSVYPNPTDILSIYQKSVPEHIYELLVMMIAVQPPPAVTNILGESVNNLDVEQD